MALRSVDLGTKFSGLPAEQPVVERHATSAGGATTAAEAGATEAAALRGIGGREFSRAKFANYLEALAIAAGKRTSLGGAVDRQVERACRECRDAGYSEKEVGVMRFSIKRELQKRGVGG